MNINGPVTGRIIAFLTVFLCFLAAITPLRIWLFSARVFAMILYPFLGKYRKIASRNISYAFDNNLDEKEVEKLVRKNFRQVCMVVFEYLVCPSYALFGTAGLDKRVSFKGMHHFEQAKSSGKPILLLNAHFGMGELINILYPKKTKRKLNFILRRWDNPYLQKLLWNHHENIGLKYLPKKKGLRTAIKNLKNGEDLIIFPDQSSNLREGVQSTFFGKETITLSLLPALSMKFDAPILPLFIFRQDDPTRHKIVFYPPIVPTPEDTLETLTQKQNDTIEKAIRKQPDHWLWLHRRWKQEHREMYR